MLKNLFKNKNKLEALGLDLHQLETQSFGKKPPVKKLLKGILPCSGCGKNIELAKYQALSLKNCPHCGTANFIPQKVKDYWLYEPIGGGGMGSVYRGFIENNPKLELAVKVLPREKKNNPFLIDALMTEAKTGFAFGEHPHLARIIDFGHSDDEYFEAMEFIEGIRLDGIIDSPVPINEKQILLWALQILSAEQHIYDCGYLFRDLKPQNIIIDTNGNARLFDFGLAISIESALSGHQEKIQGSPYYIPPERIMGDSENSSSEIYSLGMVIFHALAKRPYYNANEIKSLISKHLSTLRINDAGSKLPHDVNPELVRIINRMISRKPEKRYQTYRETATELYKLFKNCA